MFNQWYFTSSIRWHRKKNTGWIFRTHTSFTLRTFKINILFTNIYDSVLPRFSDIQDCWHFYIQHLTLKNICHSTLLTFNIVIEHTDRNKLRVDKKAKELLPECKKVLGFMETYWPQFNIDGVFNVWILKPGAKSRGRGGWTTGGGSFFNWLIT